MRKSSLLWMFSLILSLAAASPRAALAAAEGSFQRDLKVTGPVNLDVATGSGSIVVRAGASDEVKVSGHIRVGDWRNTNADEKVRRIEQNPPIEQTGNTIRIGRIEDPELKRNVSISYEITVPAQTQLRATSGSGDQRIDGIRGPLEVQTGSGDIQASGIGAAVQAQTGSGDADFTKIQGSLRIQTGSGSIHAKEIAGSFTGQTGSGDIELTQTSAGTVRADTGSGSVELRGVHGALDAETGSGNIQATGSPEGHWTLHTGSGEVEVSLPADLGFDLDAHTSSGHIATKREITVPGSLSTKELRGKVHGGGVPVEIKTGSGDIEIN